MTAPNMAQLQLVEFERMTSNRGDRFLIEEARRHAGDEDWHRAISVLQSSSDPYVLRAKAYLSGVLDGLVFAMHSQKGGGA